MVGNRSLLQLPRLAILAFIGAAAPGFAATIWNGPLMTFSQAPGSNPSLPANQDRITSDLWITRATSLGLFNAHNESSFTHFSSPQGTLWADGTLANALALSYTDWNSWAKGVHAGPPSTVGVQAVVHDTLDDIYFSIKFTSWDSGGVGGYSYMRSTMPVPEPAAAALLLLGAGVMVLRRPARKS